MIPLDKAPIRKGFLLIDELPERIASLDEHLREAGYCVVAQRIDGPVQKHFVSVRHSWIELQEQCARRVVVGTGAGCALALLIAELYPADMLVLIDVAPRRLSGLRKYARIAHRNLFSLTAPLLVVRCSDEKPSLPRSVSRYASAALNATALNDPSFPERLACETNRLLADSATEIRQDSVKVQ